MTEYELYDLINGMTSNVIQGQAVYLTTLSAYLIVAYSVGSKLTSYQVSFVNCVYAFFCVIGIYAQLHNFESLYSWGAQIMEIQGKTSTLAGEASRWVFVPIRTLMFLGSLIFMWQVRRPKTE